MLKNILSPQTCAECRICCGFDDDDIWETPVISDETKMLISSTKPETEFLPYRNSSLMKMLPADEDGIYPCPMLSVEGCILGSEKPFDCRIWPFRVMKLESSLVLTVSPVCPHVPETPLSELMKFVADGFAEKVFSEAERSPDIVKDYIPGYPILAVK